MLASIHVKELELHAVGVLCCLLDAPDNDGLNIEHRSDGSLRMIVRDEMNCRAEYDIVRKMRASVLVLGPLLARHGVSVSATGRALTRTAGAGGAASLY